MNGRDAVHYARLGLIGVLTPQANTTVEPEFAILCPPGHAFINARMTSPRDSIEDRLIDYGHSLESQIAQFANAPIDAVAFAATGTSYLIGRDEEDALVARTLTSRGIPLVTTALAVCDALCLLNATRIGLISPYPPKLTEKSVTYWTSRGLTVVDVVSAYQDGDQFHPIYAMSAESAGAGLGDLRASGVDAIVMLGTGMPTLEPIAVHAGWNGPPILSCILALVWRSVAAAAGIGPSRATLEAWLAAEHWAGRLR